MADRDVLINENTMIAIANAIRNKSNSQTAYTPAQMPAAINQISGGSGSGSAITVTDTVDSHGGIIKTINAVDISDTTATAGDVASGKYFYTADGIKTAGINNKALTIAELKDINFYDYEGTRLYSYTAQEWSNITSLPPNPSHNGLIAQGWNWTKAEIDEQRAAMPTVKLHIGQLYTTSSGALEIDIELYPKRLSPYLSIGVNGSAEIDWGDGTSHEIVTGTNYDSRINTPHTYLNSGKYTIKIYLEGTGKLAPANSNSGTNRMAILNGGTGLVDDITRIYSSTIKHIRMASGWRLSGNFIRGAYGIEDMTFPDSLSSSLGHYIFQNNSLKTIILPRDAGAGGDTMFIDCFRLETVCNPYSNISAGFSGDRSLAHFNFTKKQTSFVSSAFNTCYEIKEAYLNESVTSLSYRMFQNSSIIQITIPSQVTSIGQQCFGNCYGLKDVYCLRTTPPTANANIFENIRSDCVIHIPYSSDHSTLNEYKNATNWSLYADHMVEEGA